MTAEEFRKKLEEDEEWAPGWEAIESVFEKLYPGREPSHYGTNMAARAMFGGDCYLFHLRFPQRLQAHRHLRHDGAVRRRGRPGRRVEQLGV